MKLEFQCIAPWNVLKIAELLKNKSVRINDMRIKFRAFCHGEMIHEVSPSYNEVWEQDYNRSEFHRLYTEEERALTSEDLMQFIGKTDEDGKEIYTHDIVLTGEGFVGVVIYDEESSGYLIDTGTENMNIEFNGDGFKESLCEPLKILGNIHQHSFDKLARKHDKRLI